MEEVEMGARLLHAILRKKRKRSNWFMFWISRTVCNFSSTISFITKNQQQKKPIRMQEASQHHSNYPIHEITLSNQNNIMITTQLSSNYLIIKNYDDDIYRDEICNRSIVDRNAARTIKECTGTTTSSTTQKNNVEVDDDDSTVNDLDEYIIEMNANRMQKQQYQPQTTSTIRRRSFAYSDSDNDDDDNETWDSIVDDDEISYIANDDDDLSLFYNSLRDLPLENELVEHSLNSNESQHPQSRKKNVTFGDSTIREYGVTVGACTPNNMGTCPLELTWEYAQPYTVQHEPLVLEDNYCTSTPSINSKTNQRPKFVPVQVRRERIAQVQGISLEDVFELEYDASMSLIRDTIDILVSSSDRLSNRCKVEPRTIIGSSNGNDQYNFRQQIIHEIPFTPL